MNKQVENWLGYAVSGIIEMIENQLYEYREEGTEVDQDMIEGLIDSNIELAMQNDEWHIVQTLKTLVEKEIDFDDLIEEYSQDDDDSEREHSE